ncbi:hypothetical protein HMPREF9412_1675 [Paenibacillus sp. HGF5]|nr:hypothetical protein HMPREF9412_1675 [Paenibacillus sp. HGF5]
MPENIHVYPPLDFLRSGYVAFMKFIIDPNPRQREKTVINEPKGPKGGK